MTIDEARKWIEQKVLWEVPGGKEYNDHVRLVIETIRSFSAFDAVRDEAESQVFTAQSLEEKSDFLPFLIDCSRHKDYAGLAYEILSQ
jgi:hypothetical protein